MTPAMAEPTPKLLRSSGDLSVGLVIPPRQPDRMSSVLRFTAVGGQPYHVELTRDDVANLAADLGIMLRADADKVCSWWFKLRNSLSDTSTPATGDIARYPIAQAETATAAEVRNVGPATSAPHNTAATSLRRGAPTVAQADREDRPSRRGSVCTLRTVDQAGRAV
jgi:hypothetical protein